MADRKIDPITFAVIKSGLDTIVDDAMAQPRFSMLLVGGFGALALVLACVGLYGAVSYSVTSRTQEIGIRLALGAPRREIVGMVLGHGLSLAATGAAIGLTLAALASSALAGFLFGLPPLTAKVAVATAALPAGINTYLIAVQFGTGQGLASNQMTITTACAVVTTAFWLSVAEMVFG